jgi:hypothetical protein
MAMIKFEDYSRKYTRVKMERRDGILQMTLHTKGAELQWGISAHEELSYAFYDIARDHENRCVILTGSGDSFCAQFEGEGGPGGINITERGEPQPAGLKSPAWDHIYSDAKYLLMNHLNIEVPIIAAVNRAALIHAELAVLCDIVIAADHAEFQHAPQSQTLTRSALCARRDHAALETNDARKSGLWVRPRGSGCRSIIARRSPGQVDRRAPRRTSHIDRRQYVTFNGASQIVRRVILQRATRG